jgi:two-component system, NtrC family, nitrogen regulation sensor histidine kinase NtrY
MGTTSIQRIRFRKQISQYAKLLLFPPVLTTLILLSAGNFDLKVWITTIAFVSVSTFIIYRWLLSSIFRPLQSASNLISAIREGDFSMQSRPSSTQDALGELYEEINQLAVNLQEQHQKSVDSEILLRGIMDYIDVAVFAFDGQGMLTLINRAGCSLLNTTAEVAVGRSASDYDLERLIQITEPVPFRHAFPAQSGRWSIRRTEFRENGVPHLLVMVQDLSKSLREEERLAWKRLIRVMGHELNNSLAPIKSISGTLDRLIERQDMNPAVKLDLEDGLAVIHKRADALSRFVEDYSKIAKLPPPHKRLFHLKDTIAHIVGLQDFQKCHIELKEGCDIELFADEAQIQQLLINLTKNAIEANQTTKGKTYIHCKEEHDHIFIHVVDEGPGLSTTDNLFIPFYSTKPGGSGIGLILSQQIAENHNGSLELSNRADATGCIAVVIIPNHHASVT